MTNPLDNKFKFVEIITLFSRQHVDYSDNFIKFIITDTIETRRGFMKRYIMIKMLQLRKRNGLFILQYYQVICATCNFLVQFPDTLHSNCSTIFQYNFYTTF